MKHFLLSHMLETPAVIFGLLNIYLAARASILNWLFGIFSICLYAVIFFQVKLYADMSLNVIFLLLQFYGWHEWLHGGEKRSELLVTRASTTIYMIAMTATAILFAIIAYILGHYTDSTTVYFDSFTTALSLVAQWMMTRKWIENWWLWIVVDIISVKMYLIKHLNLTAGLYAIFLGLCVMGYFTWRKALAPKLQLAANA